MTLRILRAPTRRSINGAMTRTFARSARRRASAARRCVTFTTATRTCLPARALASPTSTIVRRRCSPLGCGTRCAHEATAGCHKCCRDKHPAFGASCEVDVRQSCKVRVKAFPIRIVLMCCGTLSLTPPNHYFTFHSRIQYLPHSSE